MVEPLGEIPSTLASNQVERMNITVRYIANGRSLHSDTRKRLTWSYLWLNWSQIFVFPLPLQ
jgi:hypothetical protein